MKPSLANVPFPSDHHERQALGNPVRYETLGHGDKLLVHLEPGPHLVLTRSRIEGQLGLSYAKAEAALPMILHVANHLASCGP